MPGSQHIASESRSTATQTFAQDSSVNANGESNIAASQPVGGALGTIVKSFNNRPRSMLPRHHDEAPRVRNSVPSPPRTQPGHEGRKPAECESTRGKRHPGSLSCGDCIDELRPAVQNHRRANRSKNIPCTARFMCMLNHIPQFMELESTKVQMIVQRGAPLSSKSAVVSNKQKHHKGN